LQSTHNWISHSNSEPGGKGIIRGVVTDAGTGKPIRNASIFVQGADPTPEVGTRSMFTMRKVATR
jgi:hypothetical protein